MFFSYHFNIDIQTLAQSLSGDLRDKGNMWINTGTSFGVVVTGPVALLFSEQWRWGYVLFAAFALVTFLGNARAIGKQKLDATASAKSPFKFSSLGQVRLMIIAAAGIGFSSSIYWTFSRSYLTAVHDFSANESIIFWIIMGAAGIIGGIAGAIIQSLGISWSYRLGLLAATASIASLTIPHSAAIFLSAILFGLSFIFMTGLFIVWGTRHFPTTPSVGVSLPFFFLGIGQSLGSLVAGVLIEEMSYPFAFLSFALFGFLFIFCKTAAHPVSSKEVALHSSKSV